MQWKRLVFFLLINILVSALTTTVVLTIWDRNYREDLPEQESGGTVFVIPTATWAISTTEPEYQLQSYQVAAGETLGEIALAFDITMDELLALNGLTDPNSIGAGTTIFVPVYNTSSADRAISEGEVPPSANIGQVEIVGIFGAGDLSSERVQIRGLGEGTLSLTGWRLRDEDGNEYVFPKITLFGNGAVDIYSDAGVDTVVSLYWRFGQPIWSPGETAMIVDGAGNIQATYTIP